MKKIVSLALAVLLVLSLAACGSKNSGTGDVSDALTLLNTVWATYSEEEKFPVTGGDYDHPVDDAPGAFDISNADNMDYAGLPRPLRGQSGGRSVPDAHDERQHLHLRRLPPQR